MTSRLAALSRSYWDDAARMDRMPEFEAGGMTGPQWAIFYRAVCEELRKCDKADAL